MMRPLVSRAVLVLVIGAVPAGLRADWPQWRGPTLDGRAPATGSLPRAWSASAAIVWRVPMPAGSASTPVTAGGLVFVNTGTPAGDFELWAIRTSNGEVAWRRPLAPAAARQAQKRDLTSPSPVTDGRLVWTMLGSGAVAAFAHDGSERWRRDLQREYGPFGQQFGFASSPLLHEGDLFIAVIHGMHTEEASYLLRLDGATGRTVWRTQRPTDALRESRDAYSTPTVIRRGSGAAIISAGADVVTAHDPATGRELWRLDGLNPENRPYHQVVASPFVAGDMLIVPTRVKPLLAFRLGPSISDRPVITWTFDRGADVPTPVSDGRLLYVLTDGGILHALDLKTGTVAYGPERLPPGTYTASLVLGEGRVYATNEDGLTTVFRAGPRFEVLAHNRLDDSCLSSLALSNGRIFIRTTRFLWAIGRASPV